MTRNTTHNTQQQQLQLTQQQQQEEVERQTSTIFESGCHKNYMVIHKSGPGQCTQQKPVKGQFRKHQMRLHKNFVSFRFIFFQLFLEISIEK